MHKVISGFGQYHTNEFDPLKPTRKLKNYISVGLKDIRACVDNPKQTLKQKAQWIIPSSLPSRNFEEQSLKGDYHFLWADLDEQPKPISYVRDVLRKIMDADFEIYTTSSATKEKPKARILIPLANPLSPQEWVFSQQTLNKLLCQSEINPDRANVRCAQLCYLPNRGEYYEAACERNGNYLNPLIAWGGLTTERTEWTDDYRGLQKITEISEVVSASSAMDYSSLPTDCCPQAEGQRTNKLFTFARYLKKLNPNSDFVYLRPLVLGWHKHFIDVIGTKDFSETWTDFRKGWEAIKVPYGEGVEAEIGKIDFDTPIPQTFIDLGYGAKEFKLLLICHQLQLINGEEPFFISVRDAGNYTNCHPTSAGKMIDSLASDGFLKLISKGVTPKASRFRCLWNG